MNLRYLLEKVVSTDGLTLITLMVTVGIAVAQWMQNKKITKQNLQIQKHADLPIIKNIEINHISGNRLGVVIEIEKNENMLSEIVLIPFFDVCEKLNNYTPESIAEFVKK